MLKTLMISIRSTLVLTVLTGLLYPLLITVSGQLLFPYAANGSLITDGSKVMGSKLIAQRFTSDKYFLPRPSASDYGTVPAGASNLAPTSQVLKDAVLEREKKWGSNTPGDLLTSSGSGLDPHISLEAAYIQAKHVAQARNIQESELRDLIRSKSEDPLFGFIGKQKVNVLELNLAIDKKYE